MVMDKKTLTQGQRDYEARRAKKAGMSLDKWLNSKEKQAEAEILAKQKAAEPPKPVKPPGMLKRLIDRAHQPLKPTPGAAQSRGVKGPTTPQARRQQNKGR
jgi:hypothetical protein